MDENLDLIWATLETLRNSKNEYIINALQGKLIEFERPKVSEVERFLKAFLEA